MYYKDMPYENHYGMSKILTRTVRIGSQEISGALGKNYIVVDVGTLSQCVASLEIGSLLDAEVFINADAEALEDSSSLSSSFGFLFWLFYLVFLKLIM